ncbi:MAG TPA: hypothetical protein VL068_03305 [Microthrixaceae bacterium]|nr:hypothetical protein [Microthrixaceae bacterium]
MDSVDLVLWAVEVKVARPLELVVTVAEPSELHFDPSLHSTETVTLALATTAPELLVTFSTAVPIQVLELPDPLALLVVAPHVPVSLGAGAVVVVVVAGGIVVVLVGGVVGGVDGGATELEVDEVPPPPPPPPPELSGGKLGIVRELIPAAVWLTLTSALPWTY